jgi:hypothetical protein
MLCEKNPPGLGHSDWRSTQVLKKKSSQLAFADSETFCQRIYALVCAIKGAVSDESERA